MKTIARVLFPISLEALSYLVPDDCSPITGNWVTAPLGHRHLRGVIIALEQTETPDASLRPLDAIDEEEPFLRPQQLELIRWMTRYYLGKAGDVLRLFPSERIMDTVHKLQLDYVYASDALQADPQAALQSLNRSRKQKAVLQDFLAMMSEGSVTLEKLIGNDASKRLALRALVQKKWIALARLLPPPPVPDPLQALHFPPKEGPNTSICQALKNHQDAPVVSLCGFPRLPYYKLLIHTQLSKGNNVLFITADTASARWRIAQLEPFFGKRICPILPGQPVTERATGYYNLLSFQGGYLFVCTRHALFLPFAQLALIVIDEADAPQLKNDTGLRYNARDTALILARLYGARTLLGSPINSLRTRYNVQQGKTVCLEIGYGSGAANPEIIDSSQDIVSRGANYPCSPRLVQAVMECRAAEKEALFLFPYKTDLEDPVAMELTQRFPFLQLDTHTAGMARITDRTGLVILFRTDRQLDRSDFRAQEKLCLLIRRYQERLAGTGGRLLCECAQSRTSFFEALAAGFPEPFFRQLWEERSALQFPPFSRLILLSLSHKQASVCHKQAEALAFYLTMDGVERLGPFTPANYTPGRFVQQFMLKIPRTNSQKLVRQALQTRIGLFLQEQKQARLTIDVDPI